MQPIEDSVQAWRAGFRSSERPPTQIHAYSLAVRIVIILHFLAHFSIENPPVTGYISGSVDIFVFGAKGEAFSDVPAVCGAPTGTESKSAARGRIGTALERSVVSFELFGIVSIPHELNVAAR